MTTPKTLAGKLASIIAAAFLVGILLGCGSGAPYEGGSNSPAPTATPDTRCGTNANPCVQWDNGGGDTQE